MLRTHMNHSLTRWLPLLLLFTILIIFYYLGGYNYLTFSALSDYHQVLLDWTNAHFTLAVFIFMFFFITIVAISVPGTMFLSMLAGFLFGLVGVIYVVISATIGCIIVFLAVRFALSEWVSRKAGRWIKAVSAGFQKNDFQYIVILRLIPIFPYWLVNISAPLLGVRFQTFTLATFIGIIPVELITVMLGRGIGQLLSEGKTLEWTSILSPGFILPLLGLVILLILPIVYKYWRKKGD